MNIYIGDTAPENGHTRGPPASELLHPRDSDAQSCVSLFLLCFHFWELLFLGASIVGSYRIRATVMLRAA